jgi:hypothetical protein
MDDKPQRIPKKYRVSLDPNDIAGYALLQEADEQQKDLDRVFNNPLKSSVANTNTTIVCPVPGAAVLWRVNVYYYVGA